MAAAADRSNLAELAGRLRDLHIPGRPLLLPNAWDAASARAVENAGFAAVATASSSISTSLGYEDEQRTPPDEMFAAIGRIARAVSVPVTADIEAGYGLPPEEVVERLLSSGAAGCNLEDTDHARGGLVDSGTQSERIAAVRAAATRAGVPIVINARIDVYLHGPDDPEGRIMEALRRGGSYLGAGADCVYPIMAGDEDAITAFVRGLRGMVNVYAHPQALPLPRLAALGVARVSFGPWLHRLAMREAEAVLRDIASGRDPYEPRRPL